MYINKKQEGTIRRAAEEISRLTTLETCGIDFGENRDRVKLWLTWFQIEANKITRALDKAE